MSHPIGYLYPRVPYPGCSMMLVTVILHAQSVWPELASPACNFTLDPPALERWGGDFDKHPLTAPGMNTVAYCAGLCCANSACGAFSFNNVSCTESPPGTPCCQLKRGQPKLVKNTYGSAVRTGFVARPPSPPIPPAPGAWPHPPYPNSTFITACHIDWDGAEIPGVQGDTWSILFLCVLFIVMVEMLVCRMRGSQSQSLTAAVDRRPSPSRTHPPSRARVLMKAFNLGGRRWYIRHGVRQQAAG